LFLSSFFFAAEQRLSERRFRYRKPGNGAGIENKYSAEPEADFPKPQLFTVVAVLLLLSI